MLRPADVSWSNVPVIVTFGAGGGVCAKAGRAGIAKMTNARTAMTRLRLITASSSVVRSIEACASTQRRHHQQLQCDRGSGAISPSRTVWASLQAGGDNTASLATGA